MGRRSERQVDGTPQRAGLGEGDEPTPTDAVEDAVSRLADRVRTLEHEPVDERPDVLEEVHRALDDEMDRLGRADGS